MTVVAGAELAATDDGAAEEGTVDDGVADEGTADERGADDSDELIVAGLLDEAVFWPPLPPPPQAVSPRLINDKQKSC